MSESGSAASPENPAPLAEPSTAATHERRESGGPPSGDYLTLLEMANWLKISRGSAWSLVIEKGEIPHYRFAERAVRVARRDVEDYIRRCRSDATV